MGGGEPTDHDQLALDVPYSVEAVVLHPLAEGMAVHVGGKVAHGGSDLGVEGGAKGEVAAQAHARGSDAAVAGVEAQEEINGQRGVLVVGGDLFGDLPLVAVVGARSVVRQWLGPGELVVGRRGGDDVAMTCDLTREPRYRTSDCIWRESGSVMTGLVLTQETMERQRQHCRPTLIYLAEDHNTRKLGFGIVWDCRVEDEDAHVTAMLGGDVLVGLLDQHGDDGMSIGGFYVVVDRVDGRKSRSDRRSVAADRCIAKCPRNSTTPRHASYHSQPVQLNAAPFELGHLASFHQEHTARDRLYHSMSSPIEVTVPKPEVPG